MNTIKKRRSYHVQHHCCSFHSRCLRIELHIILTINTKNQVIESYVEWNRIGLFYSSLPIMKRIRLMTIGCTFGKAISSLTPICFVHLEIQLKSAVFKTFQFEGFGANPRAEKINIQLHVKLTNYLIHILWGEIMSKSALFYSDFMVMK